MKARARELAEQAWDAMPGVAHSQFVEAVSDAILTGMRELLAREPTQATKTAGCLAVSEIYRREGGWCGMKAAEDQMLATWTDMAAELAKEL